jgi:hypothetical protein
MRGHQREISALCQVLDRWCFTGATLPRTVWVAEVDLHAIAVAMSLLQTRSFHARLKIPWVEAPLSTLSDRIVLVAE